MIKIKRHHRHPGYIYRYLTVMGGICLIILLWFVSDKFLLVKKVECYTQYGNCPQAIIDNLGWLTGTHLIQPLPFDKIRERLKPFVEIKKINLYRKLPVTLVLSLEMRKPLGSVGPQVLGTHVISDDEGFIIGQTDKANFPLLLSLGPVQVGDQLDPDQVSSLKILGQMNSLSIGQIVGKIEGKQLSVYYPENFTVLLDLSHIASNWYTTLQVVLTRSKIQSKMPKVIDLRFSSPIVSF